MKTPLAIVAIVVALMPVAGHAGTTISAPYADDSTSTSCLAPAARCNVDATASAADGRMFVSADIRSPLRGLAPGAGVADSTATITISDAPQMPSTWVSYVLTLRVLDESASHWGVARERTRSGDGYVDVEAEVVGDECGCDYSRGGYLGDVYDGFRKEPGDEIKVTASAWFGQPVTEPVTIDVTLRAHLDSSAGMLGAPLPADGEIGISAMVQLVSVEAFAASE